MLVTVSLKILSGTGGGHFVVNGRLVAGLAGTIRTLQ